MKCIFTLLFTLLVAFTHAQTTVSGGIYADATYTLANSPYVVTDHLVIFSGVTLTIEPGVEMKVAQGKKIEVRGKIVARGTAAKPIYVHGDTADHYRRFWEGFVLMGKSEFDYCNVSDAGSCFNLDLASSGPYYFRNSTYTFNSQVNYDGGIGGTYFQHCVFTDNTTGVTHFQFGGAVSDCIFDNNEYGVHNAENILRCIFTRHSGVALRPYGSTTDCQIYNNNVGVESYFNGVNKSFVGNKVKNNNVGVRIFTYVNGVNQFTGNEICGNVVNNIEMNTTHDANLANNCWCLADSVSIHATVYDGYKDVSRGLAAVRPFNTGCTNTATLAVNTPEQNEPILTLMPNPLPQGANLHLSLKNANAKPEDIAVQTMLGQSVSFTLQQGNGGIALHFDEALSPGVYLLNIKTGRGALSKRFVVQ